MVISQSTGGLLSFIFRAQGLNLVSVFVRGALVTEMWRPRLINKIVSTTVRSRSGRLSCQTDCLQLVQCWGDSGSGDTLHQFCSLNVERAGAAAVQ
jgi:hypothetical protein